jgi:signal transduction histidine kinase
VGLNRVAARRILDELVDNALRFSPDDSPVRVSVSLGLACIEVRVIDEGPGIDPADRGRIFGPLEQLEELNRRVHQGVGLGLSLARTAARAMDGDVELERSGREGSTFLWTISIEA